MTLPLAAQEATRTTCPAAAEPDRLQDVTETGDLVLRSAGLARLVGVRLPESAPAREAALAWIRARGGAVLVRAGAGRDRWDRMPLLRAVGSGSERLDLAQGLLENGLALADPAEGACGLEALAIEATARERGLGLWAEDRYKPLPVEDTARLRERIGLFTLVEGRVRSVGERRQQTYLNFGTDWASDFTILLPKRVWSLMTQRGLTAASLSGRRIRARGILEDRQGPALTVTVAEVIEILDEGRRRR